MVKSVDYQPRPLTTRFTTTMCALSKMQIPKMGEATMAVVPDCISNAKRRCHRRRWPRSSKTVKENSSASVRKNCNDEPETDHSFMTIEQSTGDVGSDIVVGMGRFEVCNPLEADITSHLDKVSQTSAQVKLVDGFDRHVIPKDSVLVSKVLGNVEKVCVSPEVRADQLQPGCRPVFASEDAVRSVDMKLCHQGARVDGYGSKDTPAVLARKCEGENLKTTELTDGIRSESKSSKEVLLCKCEGLANSAIQEHPLDVAYVPGPRSLNASEIRSNKTLNDNECLLNY